LFKLPLAEFVAARDALAARLKAEGRKAAAAEVKATLKPSVVAWAANQIFWREEFLYVRLQGAARRLRERQEQAAGSEELREAARAQREALVACLERVQALLVEAGHAPAPAVLQRVNNTLLALAHEPDGERAGRLTEALDPPGFEALAGLNLVPLPLPREEPVPPATVSGAPPSPPDPTVDAQRLERLARRTAARQRLAGSEQERAQALAELAALEEQARAAATERDRLELLLGEARQRASDLAAATAQARARQAQSERACEQARSALEALGTN